MEVLFELFGEILGGVYFGLVELIVPDKKFGKTARKALQFICALVMLGSLAVLWAGVIYLVDGYGVKEGVIMTAVGGVLVAVHIALAVAVTVAGSVKKRKKSFTKENNGG